MQTTPETTPAAPGAAAVFDRVIVGIDGSGEALEAARQAAALQGGNGELTLVTAWNVPPHVAPPEGAETSIDDLDLARPRAQAEDVVHAACECLGGAATRVKVVRGFAWEALIREAERDGATLIAVGSHGQSRALGILAESTTTELVHKAPCSVLVARSSGKGFPSAIVVGVDGSPQSAAAYAVGRAIADRYGARLRPIAVHGRDPLDEQRVTEIIGPHILGEVPGDAVNRLVDAAASGDLLVVGSRGLGGLRALGSVSERVAHRAPCSTLIVR